MLVITTLFTALPSTTFAAQPEGGEGYIKSVQLAQAETKEEAKSILESDGYIFLDSNLNEGTGEDGIWMGYTTTANPEEAIYDLKQMNMNGGFTLTSMEKALAAQESLFFDMANDLNYLVEEFIEAYDEESVPAQKAYKALNFFRVVKDETELEEKNGLRYCFYRIPRTYFRFGCDPSLFEWSGMALSSLVVPPADHPVDSCDIGIASSQRI